MIREDSMKPILLILALLIWAPAGGSSVGRRPPPPPPLENKTILGGYIVGLFANFSFGNYGGPFSPCGDFFATFFSMVGAFFRFAPPPPIRKFLQAPMSTDHEYYISTVLN